MNLSVPLRVCPGPTGEQRSLLDEKPFYLFLQDFYTLREYHFEFLVFHHETHKK